MEKGGVHEIVLENQTTTLPNHTEETKEIMGAENLPGEKVSPAFKINKGFGKGGSQRCPWWVWPWGYPHRV